jgi:putative membrane protein
MTRNPLFVAIAAGTLLLGAAHAQDTTTREDDAVTRTTVPSPDQRPSQDAGQTGQTPRIDTDTGAATARAQAPATGSQALTAADRKFLDEAMQSSNAEVVLGQLAQERASHSDVKAFGRKMAQDHAKANRDLQALHAGHAAPGTAAQAAAPRADEAKLSAEQRRVADELRSLDGPRFDAAYAQHMVKMHEKDIQRFEQAANDDAHSPAVRQAAQRKLDTLREHLASAESLQQRTAALDDD